MIYIYSKGGYARGFARVVRAEACDDYRFVDDDPDVGALSFNEFLAEADPSTDEVVVGFAVPKLRKNKVDLVKSHGFSIRGVKASTAIVGDNVSVGEGSILSDYTVLTADLTVGRCFHCNIYSFVAHDCEVGDFVTLSPRVNVSGRVRIANGVFIGAGATILPGNKTEMITIGENAVIGAQALVTRSVAAGVTVAGVPARPIGRGYRTS